VNRDRSLPVAGLAGVLLVALVVRVWLVEWPRVLPPAEGRWPAGGVFDGHERGYVLAFLGHPPDPSTQAWPALTALYRLLGLLSSDPRLLVGLSVLAGALAAAGVAVWTARRFGTVAGIWTGLLVAVLPEQAAWSTSAYNVVLPHALLVGALVARPWWARALFVAAAVSMRGEVALLTPWLGWPGLVGLPVAAGWLSWLHSPDLGDPWLALRLNLPMLRYLGPPVLLLGLLALRERSTWPVLGFALWTHISSAPFMDEGGRHLLAGGVAACVLVGVAAARWRHLPGALAFVGLSLATWHLRAAQRTVPDLSSEAPPGPAPADCVEVTEEPPIDGQPMPSHVGLWTGEVEADCVLWGETAAHRRWSSRGLHDRALRMRTLYRLQPVAFRPTPGGGVLLHRVERRW